MEEASERGNAHVLPLAIAKATAIAHDKAMQTDGAASRRR